MIITCGMEDTPLNNSSSSKTTTFGVEDISLLNTRRPSHADKTIDLYFAV
jgi:hypothetical protein